MKHVAGSEQGNTYGGLDLMQVETASKYRKVGDYYLCMGDCFGDDFTGPLTEEQVKAFHILFETEDPQ